jgi:hypothetical protein
MKRPTANTVPYGYRNLLFRKGVSKALLLQVQPRLPMRHVR